MYKLLSLSSEPWGETKQEHRNPWGARFPTPTNHASPTRSTTTFVGVYDIYAMPPAPREGSSEKGARKLSQRGGLTALYPKFVILTRKRSEGGGGNRCHAWPCRLSDHRNRTRGGGGDIGSDSKTKPNLLLQTRSSAIYMFFACRVAPSRRPCPLSLLDFSWKKGSYLLMSYLGLSTYWWATQ